MKIFIFFSLLRTFSLFLFLRRRMFKRSFWKNNVFRTRIHMRRSAIRFLMQMSLQLDDCREWVERPHPACGTFAPSAVYLRWNGAVCIADSARYWNLIWNTMFSKCGFTLVFTFWLITFSSQNLGFLFHTLGIEDSLVKHIAVFKSQNV